MSQTVILIVFGTAFLGLVFGFLFAFFLRRKETGGNETIMLQNQMNELQRTMDLRLGESTKVISDHVGSSFKLIRDVTERLTKRGHHRVGRFLIAAQFIERLSAHDV